MQSGPQCTKDEKRQENVNVHRRIESSKQSLLTGVFMWEACGDQSTEA